MSGTLAVLIQLLIAALAMAVLVFKRHLEEPKRPWKIWAFDASKQGIAAGLSHWLNLAVSLVLNSELAKKGLGAAGAKSVTAPGSHPSGDPCVWYLITYTLDSTVGVAYVYVLLRLLESAARLYGVEELRRTGDYGNPPQSRIWAAQLGAWLWIVMLDKLVLAAIFLIFASPLGALGAWLASPMAGNPKVELVLVMMGIPLVCNAFVFWVQDGWLKSASQPGAGRASGKPSETTSLL